MPPGRLEVNTRSDSLPRGDYVCQNLGMTQTTPLLSLVPSSPVLEGEILEAEQPAALLSEEDARALTDTIRLALSVAWDGLGRAYAGQAWRALGYSSWEDYCRVEFAGGERLRLAPVTRREVFGKLHREFGMTPRAIEAASGYNKSTVHSDLRHPDAGCEDVTEVLGRDGVKRPARAKRTAAPVVVQGPAEQRIAVILRLAGEGPLTVASLKAATGWGHEVASPALSRLASSGRLTYTAGAKRGQMGTYTLPV